MSLTVVYSTHNEFSVVIKALRYKSEGHGIDSKR